MKMDRSTSRFLLGIVWIASGIGTTTALAQLEPPPSLPVTGGAWVLQGPGSIYNGQAEGMTNTPVNGAIHAVVAHPSDADVVWIGAANGGVWKTTSASGSPSWTPMGDTFSSLSIGALTLDPTDGTSNTLVAGFGRYSSFSSVGGPRNGLLRTTNGGTNWTALTPAMLVGKNISGLAARGATIVASVNFADSFTCGNIGIFRSIDTGGSFTMISGGSGLPQGRAFDLVGDPTNNAVLYTAVRDASCAGGPNGIYKSVDTGANWTKVSSAAMDALMTDAVFGNARIAVGQSGQVYVGIITSTTGQLAALFRSPTGAPAWTQLDTPATNEGGSIIGIQPSVNPGGQGNLHFSMAADPTDANIVYVGGDRQPLTGDGNAGFPNSIGATNYTGRLFRVNAAAGAGTQSTPLTHCQTATAACNGTISTSSNSAPHADSRRMTFDAAGNLIETDDGGIYKRTSPRTTGDWFSMINNLRVTEMHDVAYDRVSNMIISGNQDTGTSEQTGVGGETWSEVSQGDGGDVAIDDVSSGTQSTRYSSFQNLGSLRRRIMNASGVLTSQAFPALTVTGGGPAFSPQFATPVELNAVDPARVLFGGFNDLYESLDRGDTITALAFNKTSTAMVFGGRSGGIDNVNLIYAISNAGLNPGGPNVFVRVAGSGAPVQTATSPGASTLRDITVDPADWQKAYVVNSAGQVFSTINAGAIWTNITGNLASGATDFRSIAFVPGTPSAVVAGGVGGVFRMATDNAGVWNQFGTGLSNAPVWDLEYDSGDDMLVAGTMGRGAWTLNPVANLGPLPTLSINDVSVTEGNAGTTNANFTVTLSAVSAQTVTVNYATADGTATSGTASGSNPASVSIPSSGNATPYPSPLAVAGVTGTITKVTATLSGFTHSWTEDVDILLVGPGGQSVVLMSDVGGPGNSVSNLTLTFDDTAGALPGVPFGSGTYQPTNLADGQGTDTYSAPAPAGGYGSTMSVFNATSPNGTWNLYVVDDVSGDSGTISGGWSLAFTTGAGDYVGTSGMLTFTPGVTTQPIAVTVNGDVAVEPNETFVVNLSLPSNATNLDGQGQGTINNDDGVVLAPPTNVVATATTGTNVNITWTAAVGAASYRVYRSSGGAYGLVGSPAGTVFDDPTVSVDTAYLYKVRSFAGGESGDSNIDLATTVIFTDPTLSIGATNAKLVHFTQLLTAVNAVRALVPLGAVTFTPPTPTTAVTIRRQHLLDLRNNLDNARMLLGLTAITYTDPAITAGTTTVKAAHINDLRNGVK